jgi:glutamyl-Q tRNA(Asp) synthetase
MAAEGPYRGRFAPSPTGPLHLGSLVAALASWLHARAAAGSWLVRIEDIDPPRAVQGAAEAQLATLQAFGLAADGPVLWQGSRSAAYREALARLQRAGRAYSCLCSRSALAALGGVHPAVCRVAGDAAPERAAAIRVRVGQQRVGFTDAVQGWYEQDLASEVGDFVAWRSDGWPAYQLAVVVDDAAQGITDVVRGADLLDSTPRQILLQQLLGLPTPRYLHVPVLVDAHGHKLGKSQGATALDERRPLQALAAAWALLGQPPDAVPHAAAPGDWLQSAVRAFDPARIPRRRAVAVGDAA